MHILVVQCTGMKYCTKMLLRASQCIGGNELADQVSNDFKFLRYKIFVKGLISEA